MFGKAWRVTEAVLFSVICAGGCLCISCARIDSEGDRTLRMRQEVRMWLGDYTQGLGPWRRLRYWELREECLPEAIARLKEQAWLQLDLVTATRYAKGPPLPMRMEVPYLIRSVSCPCYPDWRPSVDEEDGRIEVLYVMPGNGLWGELRRVPIIILLPKPPHEVIVYTGVMK